jgi:hypothetical protein
MEETKINYRGRYNIMRVGELYMVNDLWFEDDRGKYFSDLKLAYEYCDEVLNHIEGKCYDV